MPTAGNSCHARDKNPSATPLRASKEPKMQLLKSITASLLLVGSTLLPVSSASRSSKWHPAPAPAPPQMGHSEKFSPKVFIISMVSVPGT